jgi:hypothetical protein
MRQVFIKLMFTRLSSWQLLRDFLRRLEKNSLHLQQPDLVWLLGLVTNPFLSKLQAYSLDWKDQ